MDTFKDVLLVLVLFLPVIFIVFTVHEAGHYMAARLFGIRIDHVVIGYGKILWERTDRRGMKWILRSIPVKGHVHLAGEGDRGGKGKSFSQSPLPAKMAVTVAGPLINLLLPFALLFISFLILGRPVSPPVITGVEPGEAAYEAGLEPGDRILEVNGIPVVDYSEVKKFTRPLGVRQLTFLVRRGDKQFEVNVEPKAIKYISEQGIERHHSRIGVMRRHRPYKLEVIETINGVDVEENPELARKLLMENLGSRVRLGLRSVDDRRHYYLVNLNRDNNAHLLNPEHKDYERFYSGSLKDNVYLSLSVTEAAGEAVRQSLRLIGNVFRIPFQLFPLDSEKISPEAMVSAEASLIKHVLFRFFYMSSLISVFIAMVNLIPLPGLDGGRLLFGISEAVAGPDFTQRYRGAIIFWSLLALYLALVFANVPDISVYLGKKSEKFLNLLEKSQRIFR
jgi:regulator of sigma E protease